MSDVPATIAEAIEANAKGPLKASGDTGSVEQHSIDDQIKADKYLAQKTAGSNSTRGLRFTRLVHPGPND